MWEALAPFEWLMQCLSASRNAILFVIESIVVFFLYCCCTCINQRSSLVPVGLNFSYLIENYNLTFLVIDISISVIVLLIFYFLFRPSCRSFIFFQFHHSISVYQILYSPMWSLFFGFLIFIHGIFCKSFSGFQFHSSIQIDGIMFYNLVLVVLISIFFALLWKILFFSILPFNYSIVFIFM